MPNRCLKCKSKIHSKKKFCSRKCCNIFNAKKHIKDNIACKNCSVYFHARGLKQKFCSNKCWIEYKNTNNIATRIGVKNTEDSNKKISESKKKWFANNISWNKGKRLLNRSGCNHHFYGKKRPNISGSKNGNWKGGISLTSRYNYKYIVWRKSVFERDNYTCQICGIRGVYIQADHINSYSEYPDLRYDINNGRTLCVPCHYYVTFNRKMPNGIVWGNNLSRGISKF
jgi:hypothetical protein